jgi:dTDP-4-amino-4,6-dideoxy-D-galactose acyltransferase
MSLHFHNKQWDSDFFGFQVADITGGGGLPDVQEIVFLLRQKGVTLAYWKVSVEDSVSIHAAEEAGICNVDTRITFFKNVCDYPVHTFPHIQKYTGAVSRALLNLALQSGVYSRFNNDTNLPAGTYEKMYTAWIKKAVEEKHNNQVCVSTQENVLTGFVSMHEINPSLAEIELIAVDRTYRGRSIGEELIRATEHWAYENSFTQLQVATQKRNNRACAFYLRNGFHQVKEENIYHIWL